MDEFTEAEITDLFNRLDTNHDGLLDVNELGAVIYYLYHADLQPERDFWNKIAPVPWIDKNTLLKNFEDDEEKLEKMKNLIKKMNIEFNPNLSFWQYIRGADSDIGKEFRELINEKELTPVNPLIQEEEDKMNINTPRTKVRVDTSRSRSYTPSPAKPPTTAKNTIEKDCNVKSELFGDKPTFRDTRSTKYSGETRPSDIKRTTYTRESRPGKLGVRPNKSPIFTSHTYDNIFHPGIPMPGDNYTITSTIQPVSIRRSRYTPVRHFGPLDRSISPLMPPPPPFAAPYIYRDRTPVKRNIIDSSNKNNISKTHTTNTYRTPPKKVIREEFKHHRRTEPPHEYGRDSRYGMNISGFDAPGDKTFTISGHFSTQEPQKEKYVYDIKKESLGNSSNFNNSKNLGASHPKYGDGYEKIKKAEEPKMPDENEVEVFY